MPGHRAAFCLSVVGLAVLSLAGRPSESQERPGKETRVHITYMESGDASRARRGTRASRRGDKVEENSLEVAGVLKEFQASCPEFTVTEAVERAHYFLTVTHKLGKGRLSRKYNVVLTSAASEVLFSETTRRRSSSVKGACNAMRKDQGLPIRK